MCASAQAEIASENIVGYDTKEIVANNFNMFSVPFKMTNGSGFSLNKNISLKNATAADSIVDADQIKIWDAETSGYESWYLYSGDPEYPYGWYRVGDEEFFDDVYKNGLPTGTAFWYLSKDTTAEAEIIISGEVDSGIVPTFTLVKGNFNMLANPYPQSFSINKNLTIVNGTAADNIVDADQIKIWDAKTSGYESWYLYIGDPEYPYGWYRVGDEENFDDVYENGIPAGTAFWYLAASGAGSITATFTK